MPCYYPIAAFQDKGGGPLFFKRRSFHDKAHTIGCGQCRGCRKIRMVAWGMRCVQEAQSHDENCFVTLTYSDKNLPERGSLSKPDLQKFFKRVRKKFGKLSYFACGEYGERTKRAHYHACIFGIDFDDKIEFRRMGDHTLYTSKTLEELWGLGNTSLGTVTYQSACYTASYVMKKQFGKGPGRYVSIDEETGELIPLQQPFAAMSLRPAIALKWYTAYKDDIYSENKDFFVMNGQKLRPPKYYDKLYDLEQPDKYKKIKDNRVANIKHMSYAELRTHEKIDRARAMAKTQI